MVDVLIFTINVVSGTEEKAVTIDGVEYTYDAGSYVDENGEELDVSEARTYTVHVKT